MPSRDRKRDRIANEVRQERRRNKRAFTTAERERKAQGGSGRPRVKGGTKVRRMTPEEYESVFGREMPRDLPEYVRPDYQTYIASAAWRKRRDLYFLGHPRCCWKCRRGGQVRLHHLSYENLGREPDDDLLPLCERCHRRVHGFVKRHPDLELRDATFMALARI